MTEPTLPEESLFLQALELGSAEEQAAFLDRECGTDAELRRSVEALLRHHREGSGFLESPPTEVVEAGEQLTAGEPEAPSLSFLESSADPSSIGRLGHYEILELLGSGGFGVVLKARDVKLDRIVAVKTLAQSLASSATARRRFVREAKAAAAVKHENVVGIYHVSDEGPIPYLVMECVSGLSLEQKLNQTGMLDVAAVLRIGMQVASGLAAAHKQGLVHRDVKPGNILLENGVERVKITDFGLARAANDAAITRAGDVTGTPQYMSPEQALGQSVDARSDLFSLGSVLYAMCTGRSPFRAETIIAALRRVCDDTPRPIRETNPEIPGWLVAIIERLLAKQPDERFQTAAEVAEILGQHLAQLQHPASLAVATTVLPKTAIRNPQSAIATRTWVIAAAALVLLLLGISLTDATGVTQIVPTVIRIVTGEGTLVVETDPNVHVTLAGNGDLTFNLAGGQTIRVPSGIYRVKATKDGRPIPLESELVSIAKGGRQVVRVQLETPLPGPIVGREPPPSAIAPFDATTAKEHQEAWAKHLGVPVEFTNSIGMRFRLIPPGEFEMGSTPQDIEAARAAEKYSDDQAMSDALTSEGPIHRVVLSEPFYLSVTEVTQKDFETVTGENPSSFRPGGENAEKVKDTDTAQLPVQGTSWNDAANFCSRLSSRDGLISNYRPVGTAVEMLPGNGYRLPREAQWEFACRGGTTTRFWFGDQAADHANREWFLANSAGRPQRVGSLAKNPFGLLDMHGNVSEWVQDGWNPESYLLSKDRPAVDPLSKPKGPHQHLVRGGAWTSKPAVRGRSAFRMPGVPSQRYEASGLRVTLSVDSARQVIERQKSIATRTEQRAFVVIGGAGVAERKFDTLAEAVRRASEGDTIEIRGNGPFVEGPITIAHALTIRAGGGFRPVLKLNPNLKADSSLVLEGLELQRWGQEPREGGYHEALVYVSTGPHALHLANCRFKTSATVGPCVTNLSSQCVIRNCEFLSPCGFNVYWLSRERFVVDNCLLAGVRSLEFAYSTTAQDDEMSVRITRSTLLCADRGAVGTNLPPEILTSEARLKPVQCDASACIFDTSSVLLMNGLGLSPADIKSLPAEESAARVRRILTWRDRLNLYTTGGSSITTYVPELLPTGPQNLAEWNRFWAAPEGDAIEGRIRYQGGDLLAKLSTAPEKLTPEDFRLRPDSAGYRAGKDGKDLGADVDLVGPGPVYERWRKTPEYEEWLKETGQKK